MHGVLAAVALSGCGTANVEAGDDDSGEMADLMFDADWALDGTAEALVDAGYEVDHLTARFDSCGETTYRYVFRAEVQVPGGGPFDDAAVARLGGELDAAGWHDLGGAPPNAEAGVLLTAAGFEFADILLVVGAGERAATVALTLATECAEATDREIELFEAMGEWEPVRRSPM